MSPVGVVPARPERRGTTIGRHILIDLLGSGGMGVVYSAYDAELDRRVAIKILHPRLSAGADAADIGARLRREAQAMARLSHTNVVAVHDVGTFEGSVFLAMEYVEGETLRAWRGGGERTRDRVPPARSGSALPPRRLHVRARRRQGREAGAHRSGGCGHRGEATHHHGARPLRSRPRLVAPGHLRRGARMGAACRGGGDARRRARAGRGRRRTRAPPQERREAPRREGRHRARDRALGARARRRGHHTRRSAHRSGERPPRPGEHPDLAQTLTGIGRTLLDEHKPELARAPLSRALALREAHTGAPYDISETRFALAQAVATGDRVRARALAARARADFATAGPRGENRAAEVAAWMAAL